MSFLPVLDRIPHVVALYSKVLCNVNISNSVVSTSDISTSSMACRSGRKPAVGSLSTS